ncbi:MAG: glycosyltransferase family 2 protein [Bacteroidota bacterium]
MSRGIHISVVIPIHNEEENIPLLHTRLTDVLAGMEVGYELVFVNDGSGDRSLVAIRALAQLDPRVKYIDLSRNFGHQIAVTAGLDHCRGEAAVIIDADLQDPPELIRDLYARHREGFEVVYAKRRSRKGESALKKLTARWFYRLMRRLTNIDIPLDTGDFRIIDRKVIEVLKQMPEQNKFLRGQISWAGFRQTYVEYDREERHAGRTSYTYAKMFRFALDGITAFSEAPLRFITAVGFIVSGIAFLLIIYSLISYFFLQGYVRGWASQMISMLFIGGIQLIGIGIIGEYIARIGANVRQRPVYVVAEENLDEEE